MWSTPPPTPPAAASGHRESGLRIRISDSAIVTVIASEAKQSRATREALDCFVATLIAMTLRRDPAFSRHHPPELCKSLAPSGNRGRREDRMRAAPAVSD